MQLALVAVVDQSAWFNHGRCEANNKKYEHQQQRQVKFMTAWICDFLIDAFFEFVDVATGRMTRGLKPSGTSLDRAQRACVFVKMNWIR